jgi:hypothetical protein
MANCKECKEKRVEVNTPENVPYIVHEAAMARNERHVKRLVVALVVAIVLAFATNVGWLIYESQFETITYEQDGEGINNVNYGDQGDLNNGAESENQAEEEAE